MTRTRARHRVLFVAWLTLYFYAAVAWRSTEHRVQDDIEANEGR